MQIDPDQLRKAAETFGTPLYVYDPRVAAAAVARYARFDVVRYAAKANANLAVLAALRGAGAECDTVSAGEIDRALAAGFTVDELVYTSDVLDRAAARRVAEHRVHVNAGSPGMVEAVAALGVHDTITLRVNPGFGDGHDRKVTTGGVLSKHGIWHEDVPRVYERARELGLRVTGLHVHIGSGVGMTRIGDTIDVLESVAVRCADSLTTLSCGGGVPVRYRDSDPTFDIERYTDAWLDGRARIASRIGKPLTIEVEPGRSLVAHCGVLVTEVLDRKRTGDAGHEFVLVDAGFHTLARPMLYGAYHRFTALDRAGEPTEPRLVAGPLCESADVLTQGKDGAPAPQELPAVERGDLLVAHDVGAYGAAMASCYNSRALPAEAVVSGDGEIRLARPALDLSRLVREEAELLERG